MIDVIEGVVIIGVFIVPVFTTPKKRKGIADTNTVVGSEYGVDQDGFLVKL